jgi:hypothetical protein
MSSLQNSSQMDGQVSPPSQTFPGISSSESLTKKAGTLAIPLAGFYEDDTLPWVLSLFILSPASLPTALYWITQVLQFIFFFWGGGSDFTVRLYLYGGSLLFSA